ncbi:MAG TPA: hypothetical protein VK254_03500 [Candidatus Bathyarchaeia archaeon]|nr:hypothetical protein [Candidatus Bathyarchaeia archaeon]HLP46777.1 hypothetical protein [Candidatus Kapabacteria bacterium]
MTKKIKTTRENMLIEALENLNSSYKKMISESIKKGLARKKKNTVLMSKKTTYNKRNINTK